MKRHFVRCALVLGTGFVFTASAVIAQSPPRVTPMTPDVIDKYEQTLAWADFIRRESMAPMRDGVKL